jgi:hypothetical protein
MKFSRGDKVWASTGITIGKNKIPRGTRGIVKKVEGGVFSKKCTVEWANYYGLELTVPADWIAKS